MPTLISEKGVYIHRGVVAATLKAWKSILNLSEDDLDELRASLSALEIVPVMETKEPLYLYSQISYAVGSVVKLP